MRNPLLRTRAEDPIVWSGGSAAEQVNNSLLVVLLPWYFFVLLPRYCFCSTSLILFCSTSLILFLFYFFDTFFVLLLWYFHFFLLPWYFYCSTSLILFVNICPNKDNDYDSGQFWYITFRQYNVLHIASVMLLLIMEMAWGVSASTDTWQCPSLFLF